jgi:hypothetical protein
MGFSGRAGIRGKGSPCALPATRDWLGQACGCSREGQGTGDRLGAAWIPPLAREKSAWHGRQLALLGTAADAEVAARTGRTEGAVTQKRYEVGIPTARDRRMPENR